VRNKPLALTPALRFADNAPLLLTLLLLLDSLHFIFGRLLLPYLPPATSSFFMFGVATVELVVFMATWNQIRLDILRRHVWFFLGIGLLVGGSTFLTFLSVAYIDPGTASLLGKSAIVFGISFGLLWLKERLTRLEVGGAVVAIAGMVIITFQPGDYLRLGSVIVLLSALLYAFHAALVKRYEAAMSVADFFLYRVAFTTGFLFLLTLGRGELSWPGGEAWLILLLAGTVNIVLSRGLYYVALRRLNLSFHSIILTLSPVAAVLWTLLLFGVVPTGQQLLGGAAVIAGVFMVTLGRAGKWG
jgi:drug/metabolite transporter (DMT)-like permease